MPLSQLKPGLRHRKTVTVSPGLTVPATAEMLGFTAVMPAVFATPTMIALMEWTCALAVMPYLAAGQHTVGTRVEVNHLAATAIGMKVTADIELVEIDGRRLRFKVGCHDEQEPIGDGFHERIIVDHDRFMARLERKGTG